MSYKFGTDSKSNTLGSMNRENVIQETNKRRTLLKDSSWIKTRPEEEEEKIKDENFGRSILNKYKSTENLDRDNDKEERGTIHNRFKSDDALDSDPDPINKSRQSWAPSNKTTTTTTTTEESKRKSWAPSHRSTTTTTTTTTTETKQVVPGKPDGQKITIYSSDTRTTDKPTRTSFIDSARSRFEKAEEKPIPPTSPPARSDIRPAFPPKPVPTDSGERRSAVERKQRSQDLDNLIEVSSTKVVNRKSQDLDNLVEISNSKAVSSKGKVDDFIDIKSAVEKGVKSRDQKMDNLIDIKPTANRGARRDQLDELIEISDTAKNARKREDQLSDLIDIKKPEPRTSTQNLDKLIEIKNTNTTSTNKGTQNLDNLIDIKNTNATSTNKGTQNLDNLIDIKNTNATITNKGNQDLDDLIAIAGEGNRGTSKYPVNSSSTTTRSSTSTTTYNVTSETSDAPSRRSTTTRTYNVSSDSQDSPSRRSTNTTTYKLSDDSSDAPSRRSTTTTTTYRDVTDGPSTRSSVTYTQDSWKSPNSYDGQSIVSNSIKTVYSTSDRSVIEKDMCTYCRKPLGIDAKMILKELNICCHATCFKCEACSGSLGNLKAGDSMWIYKQTIHCEPCYFSAREKWIM